MLVALVLVVLGLVFLVVPFGLATSSKDQDLEAFYDAAGALSAGAPIYPDLPADTTAVDLCRGCYIYPPTLAQVLTPIHPAGYQALQVVWFILQLLAMLAATWLAAGIGGVPRTLERLLWSIAATLWFVPVAEALFRGNVSTFQGLLVPLAAAGGMTAGLSVAIGTALKAVPVVYVPAVLVMGRGARRALFIGLAALVGLSFLVSPSEWLEFPGVLLGLSTYAQDYGGNIAPAALLSRMGIPELMVSAARLATIVTAIAAIVGSMFAGRRPGGAPAAAVLATGAMLLIPGTLWYHYLVVVLPVAVMAWPTASGRTRVGLLAAALAISVTGHDAEIVALLGSTLVFIVSIRTLWPPRSSATAGWKAETSVLRAGRSATVAVSEAHGRGRNT